MNEKEILLEPPSSFGAYLFSSPEVLQQISDSSKTKDVAMAIQQKLSQNFISLDPFPTETEPEAEDNIVNQNTEEADYSPIMIRSQKQKQK